MTTDILQIPGVTEPRLEVRQCTAENHSNGGRCPNRPMRGMAVCWAHGGKQPMSQDSARKRLTLLVEPAIAFFGEIMTAGEYCAHCGRRDDMSLVLKAATVVLDRCGLGPKATVQVENKLEDLSEMTDDELLQAAKDITDLVAQRVAARGTNE